MLQTKRDPFNWGVSKLPAAIFDLNVPMESRSEFFIRLEKFSRENSFQYSRSRIHPDLEQYAVLLSRRDLAITGANVHEQLNFELAYFFDSDRGGSQASVDELVSKVEKSMQGVAGLTITRKEQPLKSKR